MSDEAETSRFGRLSAWFYQNWRVTLAVWVLLLGAGAAIYSSLIEREGFPPVVFPISSVTGVYPGADAATVDREIVVPVSQALETIDAVTSVDATSSDGALAIVVGFEEGTDSIAANGQVEDSIAALGLPDDSIVNVVAVDPGSFFFEYDLIVHTYAPAGASMAELDRSARVVADQLAALPEVEAAVALESLTELNGETVQTTFSRTAVQRDGGLQFFNAGMVGVVQASDSNPLDLSDAVEAGLADLMWDELGQEFEATIAADFASRIRADISNLESNVLTGFLAIAIIGLLLISWRAALVTGLFMVTVMLTTIGVMYAIGYSLNIITLFSLILALGLFVDDAIIAVESIDVTHHQRSLSPVQTVRRAISRIGVASLAGTLTTVLVFSILLAPSGVLGEFIELIPVTVIIALFISFVLSITLIPFLSRFLILNADGDSGNSGGGAAGSGWNPLLRAQDWLGGVLSRAILGTRSFGGKLIGAGAMALSIAAFGVGVYVFGWHVDNNTFPPAEDTNQLGLEVQFTEAISVERADEIMAEIDQVIGDTAGELIVSGAYIGEFQSNAQLASARYDLVPYTERDETAPDLAEDIVAALGQRYDGTANINLRAVDSSAPVPQFPFGIRVYAGDQATLETAAQAIDEAMAGVVLENFNGQTIDIIDSRIDGVDGPVLRDNGQRYAITRFAYDSENPTLVSTLTEQDFRDRFTDADLAAFGVSYDILEFDAGQEGDFQNSFNTLAIATPLIVLAMYILLVIQFRSLLQPLLILLAIPFTIFGVAVGLYLTGNAASFFVLVGFVGLIGISVNNAIMLTDFANQAKREGADSTEAIARALRERLRPLVTTTITTVVALLPLALADPFWEGLAYTVIFGLLSSTVLVLISFPYFYLFADGTRDLVTAPIRRLRASRA